MKLNNKNFFNEITADYLKLRDIPINVKLIIGISFAFVIVIATTIAVPSKLFKTAIKDINLKATEDRVNIKCKNISNFLDNVKNDIKLISELPQIKSIIENVNPLLGKNDSIKNYDFYDKKKKELQLIFKRISQSRGFYMQLRYLDEKGNEVIRIDNNKKFIKIIPEKQLQNKKNRDYFLETIHFSKNTFYISEINLNREKGKMEIPFNPVIRCALPIFDSMDRKRGIVIANVFADKIFSELDVFNKNTNEIFLIDEDGFYLYHKDLTKRWGKDLETNKNFKIDFPELEEKVLSNLSGVIETENRIILHQNIFILNKNKGSYFVMLEVINKKNFFKTVSELQIISAIIGGIVFIISLMFVYFFSQNIIEPIFLLEKSIYAMENSDTQETLNLESNDEIGKMIKTFNIMIENRKKMIDFAENLRKRKYDVKVKFSSQGSLGKSLIKLKEDLLEAKIIDEKRKKEDKIRNWETKGMSIFSEIQRQYPNNLKKLCDNILRGIIKYLKANQGGLFIYNDYDKTDIYLEQISSYAFDRKKHLQKKIEIGDGMAGTCALEKKTIYLENIPNNYISISSGLGNSNPSSLLITPMVVNNNLFGIIEIASFEKLKKYEINFIEKVANNLASSVETIKINEKTKNLLKNFQEQSKKLIQQEEEMRRNIEEMKISQEKNS